MALDGEARFGESLHRRQAPLHFEDPPATVALEMMVMLLTRPLVEDRSARQRHRR